MRAKRTCKPSVAVLDIKLAYTANRRYFKFIMLKCDLLHKKGDIIMKMIRISLYMFMFLFGSATLDSLNVFADEMHNHEEMSDKSEVEKVQMLARRRII
ncbi:hypothetical protein PCORN_16763 [Listeria cornellensis FSL F6-0969]|uniref:Uncharacterized protein n=2 Tax=Listeria cornellensis TaxID=1494961 RepID=W7BEG7_9LIST|nr:hypothetical protein PCORN_16763 [Listeria cornellensis FSL F6-0969]